MLLNCGVEKTLENPLDCKEIQPVHAKGDQSWVFIGRIAAEAEVAILWPPDAKSWFVRKDPDAGKDWGQEEKGTTEDKMIGWHHWLSGHGFGWTPGVGDGQGGLACCGSWDHKESDTTEQLNWTELKVNRSYDDFCEVRELAEESGECGVLSTTGKECFKINASHAVDTSAWGWKGSWTEQQGGLFH